MKRIFVRFMGGLATIFVASFLAFLILDYAPGDVGDRLISETATEAQIAEVRHSLGLDLAVSERYFLYIKSVLLNGDFGRSLVSQRSVATLIFSALKYTVILACLSTFLATLLGITLGVWAANSSGKWVEPFVSTGSMFWISVPVYGLALFLVQIFAVQNHWLPVVGGGSWFHFILPGISLALPFSAAVARLTRSNLKMILASPHIITAKSKGLTSHLIWHRHIVRNALPPVVSMIGLRFGSLLGGTFVVETIFGFPGLGRLTVEAIFDQDFPVVLGAVLCAAIVFQAINFLLDVIHILLDPRIEQKAL
jgi:ABC-type dipeptide/oligopeptide/nickel transport system permease component